MSALELLAESPAIWRYPDLAATLTRRRPGPAEAAALLLRGLARPRRPDQALADLIECGDFVAADKLLEQLIVTDGSEPDLDPAFDLDAAESTRAIDGAPRLVRYVNGLPPGADVTVVCHSYGAVVCGHAAPRLRARALIALGAPGMDVNSASQLHTRARVWAGTAPDDPIELVPHAHIGDLGHSADPTSPAFGATALPTGNAHGHNGYFTPGTLSLRNIAHIALGRASLVDTGAA